MMNHLELIETLVLITPQECLNALEIETNDLWAIVQYPGFVRSGYRVELVNKRTLMDASYESSRLDHCLDWLAGMVLGLRTGEVEPYFFA